MPVRDYDTGGLLEGDATTELVEASRASGDTGAVPARIEDAVWRYVAPCDVDHYRTHLRCDVVTVYWEDVDDPVTSEDALDQVRESAKDSASAWEDAIEGAGPDYDGGSAERQESMRALAAECAESYAAAISTLEEMSANWRQHARGHLDHARVMEDEGGDDANATAAIEALDAVTEEAP